MPPGGALGEQRNGQHPAAEMDPAPGAAGHEQECRHYHCAGVGVGPANLSSVLSIAFDGTFALRTTCRTVTADNVVTGVGTRPCDAYSPEREPQVRALDDARRLIFAGAAGGPGYRLAPAMASEAADLLLA